MTQDPNALKEYNFSLYDLQVELAKTTDVVATAVPHGGTVHAGGQVVSDGVVILTERTQARAQGFVEAVALYRVVQAKNPGFSDEQVLATIKDFISPRQPGQGFNPYIKEAATKRAAKLIVAAESLPA